jgi:CheY-like chemotaxis protein
VIRASADFLRRPNVPEEKRTRYVEAIAETAERAATLTGQLLAFARRQPLQPEVFDVCTRLKGLHRIIGSMIGSSVTIQNDLPETEHLVEADPTQFDTAILNMVINARDAMPRGGTIRIGARIVGGVPAVRGHAAASGAFVAVDISDDGTGMSPETLQKIFEPFFTTKPVDKGTGLGLSQVYGFAKQSRGEIDVASQLDVGTTFTLYLPSAAGQVTTVPASTAQLADVSNIPRRRVLLVEDNEGVGKFAAGLLKELGQADTRVGDGQAALKALNNDAEGFDLVFTDVVMPGINGLELAQLIQQQRPGLQIVLTSGYSHVIAEQGAQGFPLVRKPYSIDGLLAILASGRDESQSSAKRQAAER